MRIQHLRECIRLSQTLNFTQTAREFFITQPVLSKHISALEENIGITIFARDQHGGAITKEGETFIRDAASIVERCDAAERRVSEANSGTREALTLGYLAGPSGSFLPRAVAAFSESRPDVTLNLVSLEFDEIIESIDTGRIDMGLTTSFNNNAAVLSGQYGWRPLFSDEIVLVTKRNHPLASRESVCVDDLAGETFICPAPQFMRRDHERIVQILDPIRGKVRFHRVLHDLESIPLVMATGDYVQLGFKHFECKFGPRFAYIPLRDCPNLRSQIGLAWKKERESKAILSFAKVLAEAFETVRPPLQA